MDLKVSGLAASSKTKLQHFHVTTKGIVQVRLLYQQVLWQLTLDLIIRKAVFLIYSSNLQ